MGSNISIPNAKFIVYNPDDPSTWPDPDPAKISEALDDAAERLQDIEDNGAPPANHASNHTDGTDDIQDATAAQKGLATASQITKLDGIESGATADQTDAEIKTAYENNANTNAFTDADETKLDGIESGATADQTDAEIKTAYENNANTNAFTDADVTSLSNTIHDNVDGEINSITEKTIPENADIVLIEDSSDSFSKKKATLANLFPSFSAVEALYDFSNSTVDSDPGNGNFRLNNATQSASTFIYIDGIDASGIDRSTGLLTVPIGTVFLIRQTRDANRFHSVTTTGAVIAATGYFKIPITVNQSGSNLQNNSSCSISAIIVQDTSRLTTYHPPSTNSYTVGSGATLTLTDDGEKYKFGYNNNQNDRTFKNICLHDHTSNLPYDGSDLRVYLQWEVNSGVVAGTQARIEFNHQFLEIGDDFEDGPVDTLVTNVALTGATLGHLYQWNMGTVSGEAGSIVLGTNITRLGSSGPDTYLGDFFNIGYRLERV